MRWYRVLSDDADALWAAGAVAVEHGCGHFVVEPPMPFVEGMPDWAEEWIAEHSLVRVSERITVGPSWLDPLLRIDPGYAFGTGTHSTTHLCLQLLEELLRPGMRVLDVGTGTGVLAIAALKLGAACADVTEIDPISLQIAHRNARLHGVALGKPSGSYDLVLANLPIEAQAGLDGGIVISSGFLEEPPPLALPRTDLRRRSGWSAAVFRRPRAPSR